ncbi:MAG: hypothetical protein JWO36_5072 [Myxococcales bacterium]|nr:hypothetical protein [Myxococcales bacterium]
MRLTNLALALSAALIPAVAYADDPNNPTTTPDPTTQPAPASTPVVVTPPPAPTPVVIVNPQLEPRQAIVPATQETDYVRDDWNAPVFTTGAIVFAGSYGASVITAASSNHVGADRLYVPVVGPWLALNDWGNCPISNANCDSTTTAKVLLVADGIFQAAGILTMIDGILEPSHHRVVTRTAETHIAPTGNGFAVLGSF